MDIDIERKACALWVPVHMVSEFEAAAAFLNQQWGVDPTVWAVALIHAGTGEVRHMPREPRFWVVQTTGQWNARRSGYEVRNNKGEGVIWFSSRNSGGLDGAYASACRYRDRMERKAAETQA